MGHRPKEQPNPHYANRLEEWRRHRGLSQIALARKVGWGKSRLNNRARWIRELKARDLVVFAQALGCRPGDLLPSDVPITQLEAENNLVNAYRTLPPEDRITVDHLVRDLAARQHAAE